MNKNDRASEPKTIKGIGSQVNYSEQNKLTHKHLKAGSLVGKTELIFNMGKTRIFCDPSKVDEVSGKWEPKFFEKPIIINH